MTTTTPNLGLIEYNNGSDSSLTFAAWRADVAGISPTSNMGLIDTWAGNVSGSLTTLMNQRPPFYIDGVIYDANNYEAFSSDITAYNLYMMIALSLDTTNAGAINININSLGFKALQKVTSGSLTAFTGGELEVGKRYLFQYNGTSFEWIYAAASGSGTGGATISGSAGDIVKIGVDGTSIVDSGILITGSLISGDNIRTGSTLTSTSGSLGLPSMVSSGSYNQVQVDEYGRVVSGSVVSGGGAPISASYIVLSSDATLTNEKLLTAGSNISIVTTGSIVTVNSTGGSSPLTTKGDLYGFSTVNTRLAKGTDSRILVADSVATEGLSYKGGKVLIESQTLSGSAATISFSSIPQTFKHLELYISARTDRASGGDGIMFTFNEDTAAHYYALRPSIAHSGALTTAEQLGTNSMTVATVTGNNAPANSFGVCIATIFDYTASKMKIMRAYGFALIATSTGGPIQRDGNGVWDQTTAITSILLDPESGTYFLAGTTAQLYGLSI